LNVNLRRTPACDASAACRAYFRRRLRPTMYGPYGIVGLIVVIILLIILLRLIGVV
jgi:predicted nucleic acid-binding Zn ribbon protein